MYRLSFLILSIGLAFTCWGQNPHGKQLKINCASCHTADSWDIGSDSWDELALRPEGFSHNELQFALEGQHQNTDCKSCHIELFFEDTPSDCVGCHADTHNQTVGLDCSRCHSPESWLVNNISEIHASNGFPLMGAHITANCFECHATESNLSFNRIGNECINCHSPNYASTTTPNHTAAGYSTNCVECHDINAFDWTGSNINHNFFPLQGGHNIADCAACHTSDSYANTPTDCFSCHQADYTATSNPNHSTINFGTDCASCHTIASWTPSTFDHDAIFPINSGRHRQEWNNCVECHYEPSNYEVFSCILCHQHSNQIDLTDKHHEVGSFTYSATSCFECHPNGRAD